MKKFFALLFLFGVLFSACNDDSDSDDNMDVATEKTTTEKIQNTWNIQTIVDVNYEGTTTTVESRDTLVSGAGNTMDFRSDNLCYAVFDGDFDTLNYQVLNDLTIRLDGDVFTINTLSDTEFEFTYEDRDGDPYYDNVIKLSR